PCGVHGGAMRFLAQTATASHMPIVLKPLLPELILVGTALALMLLDALRPTDDQRPFVLLSLAGVLGAAAATLSLWTWKGSGTVLGGMIAADRFAVYFRLVILAAAALGILL